MSCRIGADIGTYNLVCCNRDEQGNFLQRREVNAFLEIPLKDPFTFNMMRNAGVPLIERENVAYALGEAAMKMAYTLSSLELKRPMIDGCVNPREKDAFQIMSIMIHSLIEDCVTEDNAILCYSVPANAINQETDAKYHSKVLQSIFKGFTSDKGYKVDAREINEGLAVVYAELGKKSYTGIGISFGGGLVNVCYAVLGNPIFSFAIVNSGDWIDKQAAKASGETIAFINHEKAKIDLAAKPTTTVERAIQIQYKMMIEQAATEIKKGFATVQKTIHANEPVDFVLAGGTSLAKGFVPLFKETLQQVELPIKIGEVVQPPDAIFSVVRGCLLAAEATA